MTYFLRLAVILMLSAGYAFADSLPVGTDIRKDPTAEKIVQKIPVRSNLLPRFSEDYSSIFSSLDHYRNQAKWYRNLEARLKKTIAQADTANERNIISQKLNSVQAEAKTVYVMEDVFENLEDAVKLVNKDGYFTDTQKAYNLFKKALGQKDGDKFAALHLAFAAYDLKKYQEALDLFVKVIENGNRDRNVYYHAAMCLVNQKKYEDAIPYFDNVIQVDAGYAEAYYYRGLCCFNTGHFGQAIDDYNFANILDSNFSKPY